MRVAIVTFLLFFVVTTALRGDEQQTLVETKVPEIGKDWDFRADKGESGNYSWINFDHKERPGEVLSFVVWKVRPNMELTAGPIGQSSIEIFRSDGSARFSRAKTGQSIEDMVRHHIISIDLRASDFKREVDAIEYTYIYEETKDATATMAHGYCMVVGETAFFVQHTSTRLITSEFVLGMAGGLLSQHFQLTGKPHSYGKGESSTK
jgi:hypothetical protein